MAFQTGTQIRPELADADYSGFVNAANIRAQAMMNLGEQIGGAITKYQVNKQKKDEQEGLYKAILPYATQYSSSAEEADSLAKAFSKDPKIGAQILQFAGLKKDTESLKQAIAVNTDTEGKVDYANVLGSYIEFGGQDPDMVAGLVKESEGKSDFKGYAYTEDGVKFAQTSRGGAQVIATEGGEKTDKPPANVIESKYRQDQYTQAKKAFESGNIEEADAIIFGLGVRDSLGLPVKAMDLFTPEDNNNKKKDNSLGLDL
jgi:hypothetical protein